jgi:hypothetical protein
MARLKDYFTQRVAGARWRLYALNMMLWISGQVALGSVPYARRLGANVVDMVLFGMFLGVLMAWLTSGDHDRYPRASSTKDGHDYQLTTTTNP